MKKTLAYLLLAALLATPLVGCHKDDSDEPAKTTTSGEKDIPTEKKVWLLHKEFHVSEKVMQTNYYDEFGNRIKYTSEDENGDIIATWLLDYDDRNNLIKRSVVTGGKDPLVQLIMTYDEEGKLIEKRECNTDLDHIYTYEYDDQGRILAELNNDGDVVNKYFYRADGSYKVQHGSFSDDYSVYDQNGNVQERHFDSESKMVYTYNKNGILVEAIYYFENTIRYKMIYQLDEHNNPVKIIRVSDSGDERVTVECEYKLYTIKVK